jgi:hypothetical protein
MAFIAATFSPGYMSARLALAPRISKLLEQANCIVNTSAEERWTLLQALAVLYAYPRVAVVPSQSVEQQLSPWAVKSAVENCALQMSLHQSLECLEALIKSGVSDITSSIPYRRSFYWLWLFVKSRHHSILTRTPPTMRNDSIIAATLEILQHLDPGPAVWRVLAETALHRLWDEASRFDQSLAEWWCAPPNTKDVTTLLELLRNVKYMLEEWSFFWLKSTDMSTPTSPNFSLLDPSIFASSITAFMGVLTRFSLVSFAAPIVSHQLVMKTGHATFVPATALAPELSAFLDCVLKSADAASKCCDIILDFKPAAREVLRYTPDYGFTMISLCCLHLVYAYQMSPDNSTLQGYLVKAKQVAYLMTDLCVGSNICPKVYGEYVLLHVRNATRGSNNAADHCNESRAVANSQQDHAIYHNRNVPNWPQQGPAMGLNQPSLDLCYVDLFNEIWALNDPIL